MITIDTQNAEAHTHLGLLYLYAKRYSEAITQLQKASAIDPRSYRAHDYLGVVWMALKENDKAIQEFNIAISLDPENRSPDARQHLHLALTSKRP